MIAEPEALSEREIQVLRLVARGLTNDQIARELVISANTVKVHLRNIFAKLGVASRTEASLCAVRQGWVVLDPTPAESEAPVDEETAAPEPLVEAAPTPPVAHPGTRWLVGISIVLLLLSLGISLSNWSPQFLAPTIVGPSPSTANFPGWTERAPMPSPRSNLALVAFQGAVYAIGGDGSEAVSSAIERWDPVANTWTALTSKPTAVADIQGVVVGGHIYVPGGRDAQGDPARVVEVYMIERNQWTTTTPLFWPLSAYALVAFEGKVYLLGGWDGTQYRDEVLSYTPEADRWDVVGKISYRCGFAGAVVSGNRILLIGGVNEDGPLNVVLEYYPALITMLPRPLTDVQLGHTQAIVLAENFVYTLADPGEPAAVQIWRHNLATAAPWQPGLLPESGIPRGAALAGAGTQLYLAGGHDGATPLAQFFEFQAIYVTEPLPVIKP